MRKLIAFCCVVLFLLSGSLSAGDISTKKVKLDNGLTLIVNEMPSSPVIAIYAWVKTGSANEGKYIGSGVTHFLEHMIFKGTASRGPGVIPDEAKAMGGIINAATGYDYTVFTLSIPKENFSKGLDLISDMMQSAVIDPLELEREREVIVKEMHMLNDRPDRKLDDLVYASVYLNHPYKNPIIGRESIFRALTREDVLDYYKTFYVPNNMILSIAGPVTTKDILPQIEKGFSEFKERSFPVRNLPREPAQIFPRWVSEEYKTDLVRLTMAYQGVALLDNDLYALDVLAMALGQGASTPLYLDIYRKKRLVESIGSGNYTPMDQGFFEINALMSTDNSREVVQSVKKILEQIKTRGFSTEELEKVKRGVMVSTVYGRETAEGMAHRSAMEESYTGDENFSDKYLDGVRRVTNEDIKRVALKYLRDDRLTVVVLKPKTEAGKDEAAAALPKADVEKVVLSNGLVLLLKEDHTLPIVSLTTVINSGTRQEDPQLSGISSLTSRVWERGIQGKTFEGISRELESQSVSFSIGSGQNSFVLSSNGLSESLGLILDYLEKYVKMPTFPVDELSKEKDQMLTAIKARKDSVLQMSFKELRETLFLTHPMRLDGLGTEETLGRLDRKALVAWYGKFLSPSNMVIALFGDIDKAKVKADLEKRFGSLKAKSVEIRGEQEAFPENVRFKELAMDKEQAAVLYGFRAPNIHDKDKYAIEVSINILSSSLGGRMFKRVRDELGKAYALSGSFSPGVDAGMATFFTLTTNENIEKVRSLMEEEFKKLADDLVTDKELADAKIYLKSDLARDLQSISSQVMTSALDELLGLGFDNYKSYNERIDAVTKEDVQAVARKYFDLGRMALVVTRSTMNSNVPLKN
ncbi:MAG: insulinase family protein [Candidatus Omnitrophica bacterium]|nr:insulinase family protein [Candidatus Omnitrophota bacterium]